MLTSVSSERPVAASPILPELQRLVRFDNLLCVRKAWTGLQASFSRRQLILLFLQFRDLFLKSL